MTIVDGQTKSFLIESLINSQPRELSQHAHKVALLSVGMARLYGCSEERIHRIYIGCLLHDIGKQFIPPAVLHKRAMLNRDDVAQLRLHPESGYRYLSLFLTDGEILNTVLYHHERLNGRGYPLGLKYDEIPLGARICAVADVWDALTSNRCYRKAWSRMQACDLIWSSADSQFDRDIAFIFLEFIEQQSVYDSRPDDGAPEAGFRPASRVRLFEGLAPFISSNIEGYTTAAQDNPLHSQIQ